MLLELLSKKQYTTSEKTLQTYEKIIIIKLYFESYKLIRYKPFTVLIPSNKQTLNEGCL